MKTIETLNAEQIKDKIGSAARPKNVMGRHFILVRQSDIVTQGAMIGQPMRLTEQRFLRIISGKAVYRFNLLDHTLCQGDIIVLPSDTIVEVLEFSDDYAVEALAVIDLPGIDHELAKRIFPVEVLHLSLHEDDHQRIGEYFDLLPDKWGERSTLIAPSVSSSSRWWPMSTNCREHS